MCKSVVPQHPFADGTFDIFRQNLSVLMAREKCVYLGTVAAVIQIYLISLRLWGQLALHRAEKGRDGFSHYPLAVFIAV